ncbi:MAG: ketopantoate reductase family protein [Sphaerochaetaceae bacterium]
MIKTVSVIGIGAVGAIYAWRLSNLLGNRQVRVIVDQARRQRYISEGIYLNGKPVDFQYVTPDEPVPPADLILIATKNHHLPEATRQIKNHVGPGTTILSLLNGIDSEDYLSGIFGEDHLLWSFATALDSTRSGNHIDFSNEGIIFFGEKDNSRTERIEAIERLFNTAHIQCKVPQDIHTELWAKFMVNVSINTISAITRGTYGDCSTIASIKELIVGTQREVIALAKAKGIVGLDEAYIDRYQKIFASLEPSGKTSMLQDIEAGRPTENAWFCRKASALGRQLGVPTPLCDVLGTLAEAAQEVQERHQR